jgi:transcriptional regulator with GAF, ATPase, and Fis domain
MNQSHNRHHSPAPRTQDQASAHASLSRLVYADRPLADTLETMAVFATQALGESPEVSLTLLDRERGRTAATSGPVALELDEQQYETGIGPCLDAARYGETVRLAVDLPDQPYAEWREAAQRRGVTHTMSIGLTTGDQVMGAMNIYTFTARALSEDSERMARTFAACIGIVLANAEQYREAAGRAAHLEIALQTRAPIEQAKGILMDRHRCTSEEAFMMLAQRSQAENVKLRVVAQDLVDQVIRDWAPSGERDRRQIRASAGPRPGPAASGQLAGGRARDATSST